MMGMTPEELADAVVLRWYGPRNQSAKLRNCLAAAIREAVTDERERCATLDVQPPPAISPSNDIWKGIFRRGVAAYRAAILAGESP